MNKKVLIIIAIAVGVLLLAGLGYLLYQNSKLNKKVADLEQTPTATITATISTTTIASKTATKTATKTPTPTTTVSTKSDEELINEALASHLNQPLSNLSITISKKSDNAVYGGVTINSEESGGYFVAVRDGNSWKVIADGNGTIECSILDQYNVPASVVGQCYDTPTETSRAR